MIVCYHPIWMNTCGGNVMVVPTLWHSSTSLDVFIQTDFCMQIKTVLSHKLIMMKKNMYKLPTWNYGIYYCENYHGGDGKQDTSYCSYRNDNGKEAFGRIQKLAYVIQ